MYFKDTEMQIGVVPFLVQLDAFILHKQHVSAAGLWPAINTIKDHGPSPACSHFEESIIN